MELDEEYYKKLNESEQRFYGIINEIRIQMGMATVEVPFYGPKISTTEAPGKPEAILEVPFVAIVEPNEDEIHPRSKNELQQQPESISRIVVGGFDDPKSTSFPSEILAIQPLVVNTTGMVSYKPLVSNFEENSEKLKKQEEDQCLIEELSMSNPEQFTDMVGSTRNFPGDLPQESRKISSSLEIKFKEGNNRTLDFPTINLAIVTSEFVFEEMGEVVDAPVEPVGFNWAVVKMSWAENLEIHSAHHVFVKLFEEQLVDIPHSVALPSTLGDNCGSIESFGSFVFDPGKEIEFSLHVGSVETLVILFSIRAVSLLMLLLSVVLQFAAVGDAAHPAWQSVGHVIKLSAQEEVALELCAS